MDPGPNVIWVAHPSLRRLSDEEENLVKTYFRSIELSGGGEIQQYERVKDSRGDTSALLIRFCESECKLIG